MLALLAELVHATCGPVCEDLLTLVLCIIKLKRPEHFDYLFYLSIWQFSIQSTSRKCLKSDLKKFIVKWYDCSRREFDNFLLNLTCAYHMFTIVPLDIYPNDVITYFYTKTSVQTFLIPLFIIVKT
jgi:hypothetical protein